MTISVLPSAKLHNIKGSPAVREQLVTKLNNKFTQKLNNKFKQKGYITQTELNYLIKNLAPNIDYSINKTRAFKSYLGAVVYNDNAATQMKDYTFELPIEARKITKKTKNHKKTSSIKSYLNTFIQKTTNTLSSFLYRNKNKYENVVYKNNIEVLAHEANHFFRAITQPKYTAMMFRKDLPTQKLKMINKFYIKNIYRKEMYPIDKKFVKENINLFFNKKDFSSKERVKALHYFINKIRNEKFAYKYGIESTYKLHFLENKYSHTHKKTEDEKFLKELERMKNINIENVLHKGYRFNTKEQGFKELFFEEAAKARKEHKESLKKI